MRDDLACRGELGLIAIDLFCGLGGWTEGLLAEGYDVIGFDIERHEYGEERYPAQLVVQDVLTLHGSQFRDAALIVASPPCQEYSYMAMPWSKAKAIRAEYLSGERDVTILTALFDACFRIQREACEAAGRHIPMVVENVRGAQEWVGRSRWNYGSFHLWGDVPALMPMTFKAQKGKSFQSASVAHSGVKSQGLNWSDQTKRGQDFTRRAGQRAIAEASNDGVKGFIPHGQPLGHNELGRRHGSKSKARKRASAIIAKIPLPLSRHIARAWHPRSSHAA